MKRSGPASLNKSQKDFKLPESALSNTTKPNLIYFHVDNLGFGELGCYGGGELRGAPTPRIDQFAKEGFKLLNFAPEAQCTPTRAALLTGRYAIRTGCHSVPFPGGQEVGLVAWEKTMGDILSENGYASACYGKWHLGESKGRFATDHGFDEWYGPIRSYDECLWPTRAEYNPARDCKSPIMEGRRNEEVTKAIDMMTPEVRRDIDLEYLKRTESFIEKCISRKQPFFLYFNHSMMHQPTIPRPEFMGKSGHGDFADSMLELDHDFGKLLDLVERKGLSKNTIIVFAGDNGNEETRPWQGCSGIWEGSYFTGMEGSLRTPCLIRWPEKVPADRQSNEIVHVADMFTTLLRWTGFEIPQDRIIDGVDQRPLLEGTSAESAREGFPFWNGDKLYGIKWKDFKVAMVQQNNFWDPVQPYAVPRIYNLKTDPKERNHESVYYVWVAEHFGKILQDFMLSTAQEPLIPAGAPLDYNPYKPKIGR
ncbi:MAG: arylsulfatase [Deltaproteobacteria bacterium]|nr:arylsulfatase [Deltaproteobacteria bacterium]